MPDQQRIERTLVACCLLCIQSGTLTVIHITGGNLIPGEIMLSEIMLIVAGFSRRWRPGVYRHAIWQTYSNPFCLVFGVQEFHLCIERSPPPLFSQIIWDCYTGSSNEITLKQSPTGK